LCCNRVGNGGDLLERDASSARGLFHDMPLSYHLL
jgi:hypothetical protein